MRVQAQIEGLYARDDKEFGEEYFRAFDELNAALNEGQMRAGFRPAIGLPGSITRVILNV